MLESFRPDAPEKDPPRPESKKLRDRLAGPFSVKSATLSGLLILAVFYTLYLARGFFLPLILAVLLSFLLRPLVRGLRKLHIPEALGAAVVVLGLLGVLGAGIYELSGPAYAWMQQAPANMRKIERRVRDLKKPVQTMNNATQQVARIAQVGGTAPAQAPAAAPSLGERLASGAFEFVADAVTMFILLYFLLASGDMFLRKLIKALPNLDKQRAVVIARTIESEISTYLSTVTFINLALGAAVWGVMALIGVPNPLLWGVMAAITNYVPYLGAMTMYAVLTGLGFLTFNDLPHALMPPGAFLICNVLEAFVLTPLILGKRLLLNPVVIFLALSFWGWMWGIAGAVMAVPIMVVFKIFCDHSETLAPVGELLGT